MHHLTELSFVDEFRWVSPLHYKKRMAKRCSSLVHVASGAAIFTLLLRRRVTFLHRTATCRPLFKPSVSLLSTYRQSSCVSNCYRTFKCFIWLSYNSTKFESFLTKLLNVTPLRRCIQLQWFGHTLELMTVNILRPENSPVDRVVMMVISSDGIAAWASDHVIWDSNTVAPRTIEPSPEPWLHGKQKSKRSLRTSWDIWQKIMTKRCSKTK